MPTHDPNTVPPTADTATLHLCALAQRGAGADTMVQETAGLVTRWLSQGADSFAGRLDELADNMDAAVAGLAERVAAGADRHPARQQGLQAQLDALTAAMRALGQMRVKVHLTAS